MCVGVLSHDWSIRIFGALPAVVRCLPAQTLTEEYPPQSSQLFYPLHRSLPLQDGSGNEDVVEDVRS